VKLEELKLEWGTLPDLAKLEEVLKRPDIGGVYLAHHETTTGLLNPLEEIIAIANKYNKLALADTVSSIAGEHISFSSGLDAAIGTSNKCFRGVPGVAFVIVSRGFLNVINHRQKRSFYSDLLTYIERERKNETPFTPPVHSLFAFREALRETLDEGVENRIKHYRNISGILRTGLKEIGLKLYLPEALYSNTMTSVYLPAGVTFKELHDKIKPHGYVIYNSQGKLQGTVFMLGVVGLISEKDVQGFLAVLKDAVKGKL
jgi:2-aminoethylphosphonate-pyruvate transaminase